jgi:butyryl-CoA dehydrogenase
MDFSLNDEQRAVRDTFHRFAENEVRPMAESLDREPRFPKELFARAAELGFFGMRYPEPEGSGCDVISYILAVEELAWGSLSVAAACAMQSLMGTWFLHRFGGAEIHEHYFTPALRGERIGVICMTEPDAGSDLTSVTTRAEQRGKRWYLSGSKTWVTSAPVADFFTVLARTGEKELSFFLVERGADGLVVGRDIDKLGVRASLTSEVAFEDTPAVTILGKPGEGFTCLREILAEIRLMTAALALGVGRAAYEDAREYADQRAQFGRPIRKFQAVQEHLAEMATQLAAARQLTRWSAWRSDRGIDNLNEAAMAKLFASEAALEICERASRVLASYGFSNDYPVERYLRDVRFTLIGGGTSEILRINIAKGLY